MTKRKNASSKMQWHIFFHEVINNNFSTNCTVLLTDSNIHDPFHFVSYRSIFAYFHNVSEIASV